MRTGTSITLTSAHRRRLSKILNNGDTPQKHVWRARIMLLTTQFAGPMKSCGEQATGKSKTCVWRWQERSMLEGVDGLSHDKTRPLGTAAVSSERVAEIMKRHWTKPPIGRCGRWPKRSDWRQFKPSNDPSLVDRLYDMVALYIDSSAHAVVLSIDEKSQRNQSSGSISKVLRKRFSLVQRSRTALATKSISKYPIGRVGS